MHEIAETRASEQLETRNSLRSESQISQRLINRHCRALLTISRRPVDYPIHRFSLQLAVLFTFFASVPFTAQRA